MSALEIAFNMIACILIEFSINLMSGYLYNRLKAKEIKEEEEAKQAKTIQVSHSLKCYFFALAIFCDFIGILIFAFPQLIKEYFGFHYIATIVVWWVPLIFDNIVLYFLLIKATYNNEKIWVKKPFKKMKSYSFDDITYFSKTWNLVVKTTKGRFVLIRALSGTLSFRQLLIDKEMDSLLHQAKKIIQECDLALQDSNCTKNHLVIKVIQREFIEMVQMMEAEERIPVLDTNNKIYSTHVILDSADFSCNKALFDQVFLFADKIKKVDKNHRKINHKTF